MVTFSYVALWTSAGTFIFVYKYYHIKSCECQEEMKVNAKKHLQIIPIRSQWRHFLCFSFISENKILCYTKNKVPSFMYKL